MYIDMPIGTDELDSGKENLKSLSALTIELIDGEALYLESLRCIVDVSHASFMLWFATPIFVRVIYQLGMNYI